MPAKVLMDVEEYLRTSFEGPDCDYLDGEVVERNMGELPHASIQIRLAHLLMQIQEEKGIRPLTEIRIQIHPLRFRVTDLAVWRAGEDIGADIPTKPPFLAVEIMSPADRMVRMFERVQDYLSVGTAWVWLIDPEERKAICYSQRNKAGAVCDVLRTENPAIEIPLTDVLDPKV